MNVRFSYIAILIMIASAVPAADLYVDGVYYPVLSSATDGISDTVMACTRAVLVNGPVDVYCIYQQSTGNTGYQLYDTNVVMTAPDYGAIKFEWKTLGAGLAGTTRYHVPYNPPRALHFNYGLTVYQTQWIDETSHIKLYIQWVKL